MVAILDNMVTVEKFSRLHIIQKKQTFIAIKTNFAHKKSQDICIYEEKTTIKSFSMIAILDAILYQGSLINCSKIARSHFSPFYAWKTFNLMQNDLNLSSLYDFL